MSEFVEGERVLMVLGPGNEEAVQGFSRAVRLPEKATIHRVRRHQNWRDEVDDNGDTVSYRDGVRIEYEVRVDGGLHTFTMSDCNLRKLSVVDAIGDIVIGEAI